MRDVQEMVRREVMQALVDAAGSAKASLHAEAVALAAQPELLIINAPVAGLEEIDFKSMLEGNFVLDNVPVMYWYLAGDALDDKIFPFSEGVYAVVADQQRGTVALRDTKGETVAQGDLEVCIEPQGTPTGTMAKVSVSGGITKFDVNLKKKHIEVCGHASVSVGGAEVKVEGCISVDW
jgi:hypothetical protein